MLEKKLKGGKKQNNRSCVMLWLYMYNTWFIRIKILFFFFIIGIVPFSPNFFFLKLRSGRPPQLDLGVASATSDRLLLNFFIFLFFFILGLRHFGKKKKKKPERSNCKNLEVLGCIAKIETLEVELKIVPNFDEIKCNFPKNKLHFFLGVIMETTLIIFMKKFMHDQRRLQNATWDSFHNQLYDNLLTNSWNYAVTFFYVWNTFVFCRLTSC